MNFFVSSFLLCVQNWMLENGVNGVNGHNVHRNSLGEHKYDIDFVILRHLVMVANFVRSVLRENQMKYFLIMMISLLYRDLQRKLNHVVAHSLVHGNTSLDQIIGEDLRETARI